MTSNQSSIPTKHGQISFARHLDRLRRSQNDISHRYSSSIPGVKRLRVKAGLGFYAISRIKKKNGTSVTLPLRLPGTVQYLFEVTIKNRDTIICFCMDQRRTYKERNRKSHKPENIFFRITLIKIIMTICFCR